MKADFLFNITAKELWDVFFWGVDYGQLLMEQERENEEIFDAALCSMASRKFAVPSTPVRRRQLHSEKWFDAKRKSYHSFLAFQKGFV